MAGPSSCPGAGGDVTKRGQWVFEGRARLRQAPTGSATEWCEAAYWPGLSHAAGS